jgi:hypothetical protein
MTLRKAFWAYQIIGIPGAIGAILARPDLFSWDISAETFVGLAAFAVIAGCAVRTFKLVRRCLRRA